MHYCYFLVYFYSGGYIDVSNNQLTHLSQVAFEPIILNMIANGSSNSYIDVASGINKYSFVNKSSSE